jgi:hypothetical protein
MSKVLENIPFQLNMDELLEQNHIRPGSEDAGMFCSIAEKVKSIGKPKAIFETCYITARSQNTVTIDNVTFESRTLSMQLKKVNRVFPFVATCGTEVDNISFPEGDILQQYWLDSMKSALLRTSRQYLFRIIKQQYKLEKAAVMSPGSGESSIWPIEQQTKLFSLLGDVEYLIGVHLKPSFLMIPTKTVSGIRFPTETTYESCQLCQREICDSRRAAFDHDLWQSIHSQ